MKKIIYAILVCIIIAGIVVIATIGLNADLIYSKNVEIDVYIGKLIDEKDIQTIVDEVFPGERNIVQEIELFEDMVSITIPDTRTEEELNSKVEELNTKINEKYELENTTDDIQITHNSKIRLSSVVMPYLVVLGISIVIVLVYVALRYKKLGVAKTLINYVLAIVGSELVLLSIIAITRFPVNRIIVPAGLVLLLAVITVLGFKNEKKLNEIVVTSKKK